MSPGLCTSHRRSSDSDREHHHPMSEHRTKQGQYNNINRKKPLSGYQIPCNDRHDSKDKGERGGFEQRRLTTVGHQRRDGFDCGEYCGTIVFLSQHEWDQPGPISISTLKERQESLPGEPALDELLQDLLQDLEKHSLLGHTNKVVTSN